MSNSYDVKVATNGFTVSGWDAIERHYQTFVYTNWDDVVSWLKDNPPKRDEPVKTTEVTPVAVQA